MEERVYVVANYDDGEWDDELLIDICEKEYAEKVYGDIFLENHWTCNIYEENEFNEFSEERRKELLEGYENDSYENFRRSIGWV